MLLLTCRLPLALTALADVLPSPRQVMLEVAMPSQVLAYEPCVANHLEFLCCLVSQEPLIGDLQNSGSDF